MAQTPMVLKTSSLFDAAAGVDYFRDVPRSLIAQQMARGFVRFRPGENSGRTTVGYRWQKAVSKFDEGRFFILA